MKSENKKYLFRVDRNDSIYTDSKFKEFWFDNNFIPINIPKELDFFERKQKPFFNVHDALMFQDIDLFIAGVPFGLNSNMPDSKVNLFPSFLRTASLHFPNYIDLENKEMSGIVDLNNDEIIFQNTLIRDLGDIKKVLLSKGNIKGLIEKVYDFSYKNKKSKLCLIGGDHSITYHSILSLSKIYPNNKIVLFQFDAHHDCGYDIHHRNSPIDHSNFVKYLLENDNILAVVQFGVRGLRSIDQLYYHEKLHQFNLKDIQNSTKIKEQLKILLSNNDEGNIIGYISFDVDVFNPLVFNLVDFPIPEGLTPSQVKEIINEIFSLPIKIEAFDIVEGKGNGNTFEYVPVISILLYLIDKFGTRSFQGL